MRKLSGTFYLYLFWTLTIRIHLAASETPRRSDDFVDAMGINSSLAFPATATYNESLLGQLGIRHYRSNVKPVPSGTRNRLASLYSDYGFRVNLVCDSTAYTPSQYYTLMSEASFESIEGLNEPDASGPRSYAGLTDNWTTQNYAATIAFQQDLFNLMTSGPTTSSKAVLSPAMANPAFSRFLRSAPADFIAVHSYPTQLLPTGNFLESFALPAAQFMETPGVGVTHLIATETGYQSGSVSGDISNLAASKYIPRTFAEYFRLGVLRTYLFELGDSVSDQYGLLDTTFSPKAAYSRVKILIGLLGESTWNPVAEAMISPAAFNPDVFDYTISGITPNIHHVLLQKSTGVLYLLLWQEIPSYDLTTHADIINSTIPVELNFNTPIASAVTYQLESTTPIATSINPQSLTVNVPDEIVVIQLTPGTASIPTGTVVSMMANPAGASVTPLSAANVIVTRTGSAEAALNVSYSIGGSATNGVDCEPLSGSISIPSGSLSADIPITATNPLIAGGKDVVLTVAPSSFYGTAMDVSSKVYINASRTLVTGFESGIQGWKGNTYSSVALDTANADTGNNSLKWVYTNGGLTRWANTIQLSFSSAQDWSNASRLELRLKESVSNSSSDIGAPVYFTWVNNGVEVGGSFGASKFPLSDDPLYRTESLDLGTFPRDKVNSIVFYLDGKTLASGTYTFYLDNICAVTDTFGVLDDFEQYCGSNWINSARSTIVADGQNADTGAWCLKWTYTDDGVTRWDNDVGIVFNPPRDLSSYSTICIRIKEDPANPSADIGSKVYFDWHNNGVSTSNGFGVANFKLTGESAYRTVELPLGAFNRDKVDYLGFYLDGSTLGTGKHILYLDNITYY